MSKQPGKQPNQTQMGRENQPLQAGGQSSTPRQQQQYSAGDEGRFASQIRERMEIIGADGRKVGVVDQVEGDRIRLTREDWKGGDGAVHHYLPLDQVSSIEGDQVRLMLNAERAAGIATRA